MLDIGINENLRFGPGTKTDDKGNIRVQLVKGKAFTSAMDLMEADADEIPDESMLFINMPFLKNKEGAKRDFLEVAGDLRRNYRYLSKHRNLSVYINLSVYTS